MKQNYSIIDAHCDTITELAAHGGSLSENTLHLDLARMSSYAAYLQFFAAWVDDKSETPFKDCMTSIEVFGQELKKNPSLKPVLTAADAGAVLSEGQSGAMLTVENGCVLEGRIENFYTLWECGVRAMTITWNGVNELCGGCMAESGEGLTPFGREVISEMNRLGMAVDVSHASEQGFWDIVSASNMPVFASHSNCYALCAHPRNLKDEQIRTIAECGGVIGLNLYSKFLSEKEAGLPDCVRHLRHMTEVGGEDCVGLGSDFDGVESLPVGMCGVEHYEALLALLEKNGFTPRQIEKITGQNFMRYLTQVL